MSVASSDSATALLAELSNTLRHATLDVLWLQWRALGAQTATRGRAKSLVDPEALVLMSLRLGMTEPRLRDVLADWTILNASLLSVQRLKNLTAHTFAEVRPQVGTFAQVVIAEAKDVRWRSLATENASDLALTRRTNKQRARQVSPLDAAALWLRLRLALGVGIKADTMAFLLGSGSSTWSSGRAIASATSYTQPAVRRALDDLSSAGLVLARKRPQAPSEYSVRARPLADTLGVEGPLPVWQNWHERFAFVADFLSWAEKVDSRRVTLYAFGVHGRDLFARHASALQRGETNDASPNATTANLATAMERALRHFAQRLAREA
jgi:DNA-binding transcriptional ArsR family regulator